MSLKPLDQKWLRVDINLLFFWNSVEQDGGWEHYQAECEASTGPPLCSSWWGPVSGEEKAAAEHGMFLSYKFTFLFPHYLLHTCQETSLTISFPHVTLPIPCMPMCMCIGHVRENSVNSSLSHMLLCMLVMHAHVDRVWETSVTPLPHVVIHVACPCRPCQSGWVI